MDLSVGVMALYLSSCLVGALIQSISGFGFAIFMMSVIPNVMPYSVSAAVSGLLSMSTNAANVTRYRKYIDWKQILYPTIGYFAISFLVVSFLAGKSDTLLKRILGGVLVLLSIYFLFFSSSIHIQPTPRNGLIAGGLSGVLGGLFSMSGPPMVVYMLSTGKEKEEYLGTIQVYFFLTNLYTAVLRAINGMITLQVVELALVGAVFSGTGFLIGVRLLRRIDAVTLKKIIYGFMAVSGLSMLLR